MKTKQQKQKHAEYMREYRKKNLEKIREADRKRDAKRRKTKKYKEYHKKYNEENSEQIKEQRKKFYINNRERIRKQQNEYARSPRGREVNKKAVKKYRSTKHGKLQRHKEHCRRKGYGSILICENIFPDCIDVEWHHIDDEHIIVLPNKIHQETTGTNDVERHRQLVLEWIEIFYPEEIYNICKSF